MGTGYWYHKLLSILFWIITAIYMIGIILLHRRVNQLVDLVKEMLGLSSYLLVSRTAGLIVMLWVLFWVYKRIVFNPGRLKVLFLLIPLALVADLSLIVVPIERIHYIQYGLLTVLCYITTRKAFLSALMAFFVGVVDEAYQYWVLYANNRDVYFDWNDITLNLMGILIVLFFFLPESVQNVKWLKKPVIVSILLWVVVVNLLVPFLNLDLYLFRNDPYKNSSSFWITSNINTTYHVMNSLEGLTLLGILLILTTRYFLPSQSGGSPS